MKPEYTLARLQNAYNRLYRLDSNGALTLPYGGPAISEADVKADGLTVKEAIEEVETAIGIALLQM